MPHHESGLVALRTTDPKVIDRAAKHFLDIAPHPCVQLVRADGGKGVWMCFGSFVDTDVSGFLDAKANAKLAKVLKQPLWVGHAIGGYSNFQTAMAFSSEGKRIWSSTFDFNFPADMAREVEDPFCGPEQRFQRIVELRASHGYGRIATEFGIDYFRVLAIDAGDALFAKEKRELGKKGAKEHAKWLTGKFVSPEGEPGDGALPPPSADRVGYRLFGAVEVKELVGVVAHLAASRNVASGDVGVRARVTKGECILLLEGAGVRALSTTLCSDRFIGMLGELSGASLLAYGWDQGEQPSLSGGVGRGADVMQFMRAQREPLELKGDFKRATFTALPETKRKVDRLRKAMATSG